MSGFTKLFGSIVTSTIWQEDPETKVVWITLLALADAEGFIDATIPGLANIANIPIEKTREAIEKLESPDPDSRTVDFDGRRITKVDSGWLLLNYMKYRKMRDPEERKEYMRKYMKEYRKQNVNNVNSGKPKLAQAEAEAEEEFKNNRSKSCVGDNTHSNNGELFDIFWSEYPRKVGKKKCRQIWERIKPSVELTEKIIATVKAYKRTEGWQKDNGKFIPHPATWLNQERWDDQISASPEPKRGDPDWLPTEQEAEKIMRDSGIEFENE